ncbi:hypothetical protein CH371_11535 [Leptospira wolffii]|uniref:Uncharacterized protein n=1 Tax=Leptospira wolffii TaxID=409998 RepID=A0A2M9ZAZ0_9LEPT|nr:hypothetical protein CH371_11535 [Leptospira wolffii]
MELRFRAYKFTERFRLSFSVWVHLGEGEGVPTIIDGVPQLLAKDRSGFSYLWNPDVSQEESHFSAKNKDSRAPTIPENLSFWNARYKKCGH